MEKWTVDFPIRSIQTNLREIDWIDINAEKFAKDLDDFNANVVWLNTAGIIANYPTKLPFHYQNPYLKGDTLEDVIEACHKKNIRVIARNDFSKIRRQIYEAHPEWAYRTFEGDIVDYNGNVHVCFNGDYQQIYAFEILKELLTNYSIDAVFCNAFGFRTMDYSYNYYGICHCESCKSKFFELFKTDLPKVENLSDPKYGKYLKFKQICIEDYQKKFNSFLTELRPDIAITDVDFRRLEVNTEFEKRSLPHWQYGPAYFVKSYRGLEPIRKNISASTVDFIGYYYRHVAVTPELQKLRLWQTLTNLGGIDWYLMGRIDNHQDRSGFSGIKRVFEFAKNNVENFRNFKIHAETLLLAGTPAGEGEVRGWLRVLSENHIQFDMTFPEQLLDKDISKYRVIIIPNLPYLADAHLTELDLFAEKGGTVVITGETGIYNDICEKRKNFGLRCAGVKEIAAIRDDMVSAMFLLDKNDKRVFVSFSDTDIAYFGNKYVFVIPEEGSSAFMRMVPPHMFGPPERCYYTQVTDHPSLRVFNYGKGRGIHIPWLPGKLFYDEGYSNPANIMKDILLNLSGLKSEAVDINPMVEMTVAKRPGQILVQFTNLSGHFGVSYFSPVPLYNQSLVLSLNRAPKKIVALKRQNCLEWNFENKRLKLVVKELLDYESILITE
jgi:hypothetical protein